MPLKRQLDEAGQVQDIETKTTKKAAAVNKKSDVAGVTAEPQTDETDTSVPSNVDKRSTPAAEPDDTACDENKTSAGPSAPVTPSAKGRRQDHIAPPSTPAGQSSASATRQTPASAVSIGRLINPENDAAGYSDDEGQTTPRTPKTGNKAKPVTVPLNADIAATWDMSEKKKQLIMKLLDVQAQTTFAIRRMPTTLRFGTGENKDRLVINGRAVTVILVGRIGQLYFETTKLAANINIVPLLSEDLGIASRLIGHYSQPSEDPKDYPSIRASINQAKEPGTNTYKLFDEIYDATKGLKRKQDAGAKLNEDLSIGDLVALELHVKRYSRQGEKAKHASYELVAVQMLRRGNADDVNEVQASVSPAKTDAFGEDFFAT